MERKKITNSKAAQPDFYAEALKAFDAPVMQAVPRTAAAKEPVPMPVMREENADIQPPKPVFWRKWWPAILSIATCIVLLAGFLPWGEKVGERGGHWVYGTVSVAAEEMMIIEDNDGQRWYVELDGIDVPEMSQEGVVSLWVFYNGEPEETDELNCKKKVTASYVCNTSVKIMDDFAQYGLVYDQISFDLDGDGKQEQWLLCKHHVWAFDSLLHTSSVPFSYRLIALEEDGSEKYNVLFYPTAFSSHVFNIINDKLSLIGVSGEDYVITVICLSGGQVTFECNGVPIDNEPPWITSTLMTSPPTGPSTGSALYCAIQFSLTDSELNSAIMEQSDWIDIPAEEGNALKNSLDALQWEAYTDEAVLGGGLGFTLSMDENLYSYELLPDGTILWNDQVATVNWELWENLVLLMGCDANIESKYEGYPGEDAEMQMIFDHENATADIYYKAPGDSFLMYAKYGAIGNYLYVLNTPREVKYTTLLVLRIHDDGTLALCGDLSKMHGFDLPDELVLLPESMPIIAQPRQVSFCLTPQPLQSGDEIGTGYYGWVLSKTERETFYKILSGLQWIEGADYVPIGTMRVIFEDGSTKEYSLLDGGMLAIGNKHAILGEDSRSFIMDLLIRSSTVEPAQAAYTAGDNIWLTLNEAYLFELNYDGIVYAGTYVQLGRVLYLSTTEGASFLLVQHSDGTLEYVDSGYGYMLPDGLRFIISTAAE